MYNFININTDRKSYDYLRYVVDGMIITITAKLDGLTGYIEYNDTIIVFGCYKNSNKEVVFPTLYYDKKGTSLIEYNKIYDILFHLLDNLKEYPQFVDVSNKVRHFGSNRHLLSVI